MKREVDELQNEMNKALETLCDTINTFEKKKGVLLNQYIALNEIKYEKEKIMNYYELIFMGFDGDFYNQEARWLIRTDRNYNEMQDYVHNLNMEFKKDDSVKSFFYINETWVYNQMPTYDELLDDLREL